ncbi:Nucleolar protein 56 [Verticillium dahliae VDG1]|nr:Nucleolar protein 56 [Verticillium dahliae VDG1]
MAASRAGNRNRVVFVNGGYENGPIDSVIDSLTTSAQAADGIEVLRRSDDSSLNIDCEPGQRAVTDCFGAVSFYSSPSEGGSSGDGSLWNYTIFLDGAIHGLNIHVDRNNNDVDKFLLPLQRAVDAAIANVTASNASDSSGPQPAELPATIDRLPFTSLTEDEYEKQVREDYQSSIINFLAVAYLTTVMFVIYHMTGFIATERESGMTQLIDAMMPIRRRWVAQLARVISYHVAFSLLYLPGWVIGSIVLRANIWSNTSIVVVLVYYAKEQNAAEATDEEVAKELTRVTSTQNGDDGLKVTHVTKSFGKNTAVDNVTFGIKRGEVFACLGPNGAGKSTLISLIRGDLKPSHNGGDIFIEDKSVISNLAAARGSLGVCPQHDALDQMTVREHLEFYARIRGIPEIDVNVNAVIDAVGLRAFSDRQAHALSGGNKRKLSLGIALMGNPTVVLLDEPSSGLDAAAKRIMWKTLAATVPGRSILLTTHSMEEAGALAGRAGILAKRMLALGTPENLRRRFGDALHVHLISKSAPHTSPEETERVRQWVESRFPGAEFDKTYHGQMRFAVPASEAVAMFGERHRDQQQISRSSEDVEDSAVGQLVVMLEEMKEELGIMHFSVTPTTLDQVFLTIVGNHNIQEEGYKQEEKKKDWKYWLRVLCCWPRR